MDIEIRYMAKHSARSLQAWLCHAWNFNTPAAGRAIGVRLMGWSATYYPHLPGHMKCIIFRRADRS